MRAITGSEPRRNTGFQGPDFKILPFDQWCHAHAHRLERTTIRVSGVGDRLEWTVRSRRPCSLLSSALGGTFPEREQTQYLVLSLQNVPLAQLSELAKQVANHAFATVVIEVPTVELGNLTPEGSFASSPYWQALELAVFSEGLRKHSAYYDLSGPARSSAAAESHIGCYCGLHQDGKGKFGLSFLKESRELHMDMLRETGPRSDAHVLRYHFAAKRILDTVGPGAAILDTCCGMGYGTQLLHDMCRPISITGVDIDERAIGYARRIYGQKAIVSFAPQDVLGYLNELQTDSLDAVVMFEGLEHIGQVDDVLMEINRVLKNNGIFLSSVPNQWVNPEGIDENPWHATVFRWDSYRAILSRYLTVESTVRQIGNRYNDGGAWHPAAPCFENVEPSALKPEIAEWWLAVSRSRSVPGRQPREEAAGHTFELQEALARLNDPEIRVVSFDIFDTLLARPTISPSDVFYILQQALVEELGELYSGFALLRMRAERDARQLAHQKGLGDITLDEIYVSLASLLGVSAKELELTKSKELELERKLLAPRIGVKLIYERARELGKSVIVISDMYLPSDFLSEVLVKQGYTEVTKLWVSSEHRVQKRTGELYQLVLDELGTKNVRAEQLLHIGDNKGSDIEAAARYGILTLHTPKATERYAGRKELWPSGPLAADCNKTNLALRSFVGCQINAAFHNPFRSVRRGTMVDRDPYLFGRLRLAPFIYFAMDAFLRRCELHGVNRVFFATRDGHVTREVFKRIAIERGVPVDVLDLEISRGVLDLLQCQSLEAMGKYIATRVAQGKTDSLLGLLTTLLGQGQETLFSRLSESELGPEMMLLSEPMQLDRMSSYQRALRAIWPLIANELAERTEAAEAYIRSKKPDGSTAVWDVGYFHSIANALARQGTGIALSGHMVELAHHQNRVARRASGFDTHAFLGAINNVKDSHPFTTDVHALLLELLLGDPSTATRSVFSANGEPVVSPEKPTIQRQNRESLDAVHDGVCDAVTAFHAAYGTTLAQASICPTEVLDYAFHQRGLKELLSHQALVFENNGYSIVSAVNEEIDVKRHPV